MFICCNHQHAGADVRLRRRQKLRKPHLNRMPSQLTSMDAAGSPSATALTTSIPYRTAFVLSRTHTHTHSLSLSPPFACCIDSLLSLYVPVYACMHVCMGACMYVCMYVFMCVRMYACNRCTVWHGMAWCDMVYACLVWYGVDFYYFVFIVLCTVVLYWLALYCIVLYRTDFCILFYVL